jgi:DNA-binding IclR family transcriptional regulator
VLLAEDVVIIHHEPRPDGSRQMPEVGIVIPAHACALGKALLAFSPADEQRVLFSALRSMTGETLTDAAAFKEELESVRASGLATESDEAVLGESGLAATVFDAAGLPVGAIGVVVPTTEWPVATTVADAVRSAARTISRELGALQWPAAPPI